MISSEEILKSVRRGKPRADCPVLGTWTLKSYVRERLSDGHRHNQFGDSPAGYIGYAPDGRMYAIFTRDDRITPRDVVPTDEEGVELIGSMVAYAGIFSLGDNVVVHHIDTSWNQVWTGTDQIRHFALEGDTLTITTAPYKSYIDGSLGRSILVWTRVHWTQLQEGQLVADGLETMIDGKTKLIAHIGYPTESFKSPMIYNPFFKTRKINAVVVPMGCKSEDYPSFLKLVFRLTNVHGALITMPHKVTTLQLVDRASVSAKIAGACNAVRIDERGVMIGDMFDGEGFVRGVLKKGRTLEGASALVAGCGGVGSAIAASLAKAGVSRLGLYDAFPQSMNGLAERLKAHYPNLAVTTGSADPAGYDIVINATPLGMKNDDPLPMNVDRISPSTFVGEVVMKEEITPFLAAVRAKGCAYQVGTEMLFEQIPAYLEFFGFGAATSDELRKVAQIHY